MKWTFYSQPVEFRAFREGTSKKTGKDYGTIIVEDDEGEQNRITVGDTTRFPQMRRLKRGEWYSFPLTVIATAEWQFARLNDRDEIIHMSSDESGMLVADGEVI